MLWNTHLCIINYPFLLHHDLAQVIHVTCWRINYVQRTGTPFLYHGDPASHLPGIRFMYVQSQLWTRIGSVGYPQIYTGGSYPLFLPYRGLLWVLWPSRHNTLYFCEFWQLHHNTLHFCEFCNRSGTPQRIPWQLCIPYPTLMCVLWLLYHNTLYFREFCDSCTIIPYTFVNSVTDPVPHREYPHSSVYNTLHLCEFCDCCTTIPYTFVSSVTDPVPHRDYPYPTEPIREIFRA